MNQKQKIIKILLDYKALIIELADLDRQNLLIKKIKKENSYERDFSNK